MEVNIQKNVFSQIISKSFFNVITKIKSAISIRFSKFIIFAHHKENNIFNQDLIRRTL